MKKTLPVLLFILSMAGPAMAEHLVIELISGNAIVVEYSGSIHNVSMEGDSDAIAGFNPGLRPVAGEVQHSPDRPGSAGSSPGPEKRHVREKENSQLRLRWAEPLSED
ncbi:MAG: hypothetical protein LC633_03645 [Desulfobulbaceae bacterium]|nr:hypothetical protein [Desulfobulbaceae bacterium]